MSLHTSYAICVISVFLAPKFRGLVRKGEYVIVIDLGFPNQRYAVALIIHVIKKKTNSFTCDLL